MNRRGVALLAALLAVVAGAALASLALAAARLRLDAGRRQLATVQARALARGALASRLDAWSSLGFDSLPPGGSAGAGGYLVAPGLRSRDSVYHLAGDLYLLRSLAERLDAGGGVLARDRQALVVSLPQLRLPDTVAVLASGAVMVSGSAALSGVDQPPPGWAGECPVPEPAGPAAAEHLAPPIPGAVEEQLRRLAAGADLHLAGLIAPAPVVTAPGNCSADTLNWGDPSGGVCGSRFPVVALAPGSTVVSGTGQGILIGLGSLQLSGNFCFAGVIVALGDLRMRDGACLNGLVVTFGDVTLTDSSRVSRSTCATRRVAASSGRLPPEAVGWFAWP